MRPIILQPKTLYVPCKIEGMPNPRKYRDILNLGYKFANEIKYAEIPVQTECKKGKLVSRAIFMKNEEL
jgi:hypothetical protein